MIHDKDYIIRIVKQFSEMIASMLLGKNEGEPAEEELVFETRLRDVFKMSLEELTAMSTTELNSWVEARDAGHRVALYELLGNLFFYCFRNAPSPDLAAKAKHFMELWLQESKIFSLPVTARLGEIRKYLENPEAPFPS